MEKTRKVIIVKKKSGLGVDRIIIEVLTLIPNPEPPLCKSTVEKKKNDDVLYLARNYED